MTESTDCYLAALDRLLAGKRANHPFRADRIEFSSSSRHHLLFAQGFGSTSDDLTRWMRQFRRACRSAAEWLDFNPFSPLGPGKSYDEGIFWGAPLDDLIREFKGHLREDDGNNFLVGYSLGADIALLGAASAPDSIKIPVIILIAPFHNPSPADIFGCSPRHPAMATEYGSWFEELEPAYQTLLAAGTEIHILHSPNDLFAASILSGSPTLYQHQGIHPLDITPKDFAGPVDAHDKDAHVSLHLRLQLDALQTVCSILESFRNRLNDT